MRTQPERGPLQELALGTDDAVGAKHTQGATGHMSMDKPPVIMSVALLALLGTACLPELTPPQPWVPTPTVEPTGTVEPSSSQTPSPTLPHTQETATLGPTSTLAPTPTQAPTPTGTPEPTPTATVNPNVDLDFDGYTTLQGDCDPRDPTIYPGALETPFDGIDSNCNGVQDQADVLVGARLNEGGDARYGRLDDLQGFVLGEEEGEVFVTSTCRIRHIKDGVVNTIAGTGFCGAPGDPPTEGLIALETDIDMIGPMALDTQTDRLYLASDCAIWALHLRDGTLHRVAGTGVCGAPIPGSSVTTSPIQDIAAISFDPTFRWLYVALNGISTNYNQAAVMRFDPSLQSAAYWDHIAGEDEAFPWQGCVSHDEAEIATEASLCDISAMHVEPGGDPIYLGVAWGGSAEVVEISEGELQRIVGTGIFDFTNPEEPNPKLINLYGVTSLTLDQSNNLFLLDQQIDGNVLLKVNLSSSYAEWLNYGDGNSCYASLFPNSLKLDDFCIDNGIGLSLDPWHDTGLWIADSQAANIWHIDLDTQITNHSFGARIGFSQEGNFDESLIGRPTGIDVFQHPQTGVVSTHIATDVIGAVYSFTGNELQLMAGDPLLLSPQTPTSSEGEDALEVSFEDVTAVAVSSPDTQYIAADNKLYRIEDNRAYLLVGEGLGSDGDGSISEDVGYISDMVLSADLSQLYLAATYQHAILSVSLQDGQAVAVSRLIGTGVPGVPQDAQLGLETQLTEPTDLDLIDGKLLISMDYSTQLYSYEDGYIYYHGPELSKRFGFFSARSDSEIYFRTCDGELWRRWNDLDIRIAGRTGDTRSFFDEAPSDTVHLYESCNRGNPTPIRVLPNGNIVAVEHFRSLLRLFIQ